MAELRVTHGKSHSIGTSLLAMMVSLVGILALMLSFSHLLKAHFTGVAGPGAELVIGLSVAGTSYLLLACGLWKHKRWTRRLAFWLLPLLTLAGVLDTADNKLLALSTMLVFVLGFVSNLAVILALHRPQTRALFYR